MDNKEQALQWGSDCLISKGYIIEHSPEILLSTPWSTIIRFDTSRGIIFLKHTPSSLFLSLEPKIISMLSEKFSSDLPSVIAVNDNLHCFLMNDAGEPLRKTLKSEFNVELLCQAIRQYVLIQRSTEKNIASFLSLCVPDWRLDKLPKLYDHLVNQIDFLKGEGITDDEVKTLQYLSPKFLEKCILLANYGIPETLGRHDFHDNNILIDPKTNKMIFIDLGESVVIHPFFPLYTCLRQATTHHGIKENDQIYQTLQNVCFENWLGLKTKKQLQEAFILAKELWPIFSVLACYEHMMCVDLKAYRAHYANRSNKIVEYFKEHIENFR